MARARASKPKTIDDRQRSRILPSLALASNPDRMKILMLLDESRELSFEEIRAAAGTVENSTRGRLVMLQRGGLVNDRRVGKMALYSLTQKGREFMAAAGVLFRPKVDTRS